MIAADFAALREQGWSGCTHDSDCACSAATIERDDAILDRKPLRFIRGGKGMPDGVHTAYDRVTGLAFVVARVETSGPRGGRVFEYEIDVMEPGAGGRTERGILRFDTARERCAQIVADRLSGADR